MLRAALFAIAICAPLSWAMAQLAPAEWDAFDTLATAVEQDLQDDILTDKRFEELRRDLVDWRERFLEAQDANTIQIESLSAQLDALGPPPAEGETEAEITAQRREELSAQLEEARAPRIEAEEGYARANTLIGEIDETLRDRQTDEFFELQRTPLSPSLWGRAYDRTVAVLETLQAEVHQNLAGLRGEGALSERLPLIVGLLAIAIALIVRGPTLVERVIARIENRSGEHGRIVYGFFVSLVAILAPMLAVSLINLALISSGLLGETGQAVAIGTNAAIIAYAVGRWLGTRMFPEREFIPSPLNLPDDARQRGRRLFKSLGLLVGALSFIRIVDATVAFEPDLHGVMLLPFMLGLAYVLFALGGLIRAGVEEAGEDEEESPRYVLRLVSYVLRTVAIVAPLAALIGYVHLAERTLLPTAISLALLAFLSTLHFVIRSAYALIRGLSTEGSDKALIPVLISFFLVIASLPLLGLIWGMRPVEIAEVWTRFRTGFAIGDTTISPGDFLTFAVVFGIAFMLVRLAQGTLRQSVLPRTKLDKGGQNAIVSGVGYIGVTLAALAGITSAGIDLSSFAIVLGALGVGIGFGLQNIVNNFVSGIILLIERPISEGDWIEVNGQMGYVRAISVRSTRIETFDRRDVIVPNGDFISGTVTNWTRGNSIGRVTVPVGVAYGTDTRKVEKILREVAESHPIVAVHPEPVILFRGFGADSLDFEIRAILTDVNYILTIHSDMNHEIAKRFQEEGIEIPFAQRDVWLRNPEALRPENNGN